MIFIEFLLVIILFVIVFLRLPKFGESLSGKSLKRFKDSPNFRDGKFQNINYTPDLTEGATYYSVMKKFFFESNSRNKPVDLIPSKKTNLLALNKTENILVWFGHSSYFMQIDGKRILVDPVLSGSASPISFTTKSFMGTDIYSTDDIPEIDYLFISHDHWDHLDYKTILKLKTKIKKIICGLGVGAHLQRWGFEMDIIVEKDWNEEVVLDEGFIVNTTSARHFSGRGFKRNQSLWMSFVLKTPALKIFIGGDSGYDTHFAAVGNKFGPFDLAILECGQYDMDWKYIHMMPEEVVQASLDLKSEKLLAIHWGKFALGKHDWDDPAKRVLKSSKENNVVLLTPMIGEKVELAGANNFSAWWEGLN